MLEKIPGIRCLPLTAFAVVVSVVFLVSSASAEPVHVGGAKDFAYDAASNDGPSNEFDTPTRIATTSNEEIAATAAQGPSGDNYDLAASFVAPSRPAIGPAGNPGAFPRVTTPRAQLEAKFKHAVDFGVTDSRGAAGFEAFGKAIDDFVSSPTTVRVSGTYRQQSAVLNYDLTTRQVVVQRPNGEFWTGFQMSPAQARNVFQNASLGGG